MIFVVSCICARVCIIIGVKLLIFQARHFSWKAFSKTLESAPDVESSSGSEGDEAPRHRVEDAVVVFFHAEAKDEGEDESQRIFKRSLKHIKWIAGKRKMTSVVLHSFTHLGGENAAPEFAQTFMERLDERLSGTGYEVARTPFGYFCEWDLAVYGESLAKVWKEF